MTYMIQVKVRCKKITIEDTGFNGIFRRVSRCFTTIFSDGRNSTSDFSKSKNLFKRAKIRDDFFATATVFGYYSIQVISTR